MTEQENVSAAANLAGSTGSVPAAAAAAGQTQNVDWERQYKELETKFGAQGRELGEYREFITNTAPLLDKLEKGPELVQAILDGKVDVNLAKAAIEGRLTVNEVAAATAANAEVQKELGQAAYQAATPDEIGKLVEAKVSEKLRELEERDELRDFQRKTEEFMQSTPDFVTYADAVDKWLDEHPQITDIDVAYHAVKGELSVAEAKKVADEAAAENAKNVILNAGPGGVQAQYTADGTPLVDKLISGRSNANNLF